MDPVIIAQEGVDKFKQENFEIIIVDTRCVQYIFFFFVLFYSILQQDSTNIYKYKTKILSFHLNTLIYNMNKKQKLCYLC